METFNVRTFELIDELKRRETRKKKNFGVVNVTTGGIKLYHGLGLIPDEFNIVPVMEHSVAPVSWWFWREPDSNYIYIQSSVDGKFLISVAGG